MDEGFAFGNSTNQADETPAFRARRAEIVRTAAILFDTHGFHETSMGDIARAVGIKKPTLYHYLEGKGEIVYWIHEGLERELRARLERRLEAQVPPTENLREVMCDILTMMDSHPGHLRVYFENHRNLPERIRTLLYQRRAEYFRLVEELIVAGMDQGQLRRADSRLTAMGLFGMCNWSYQWYRPGGTMGAREVADYLWNLLEQGIGVPESTGAGHRVGEAAIDG